MSDADNQPNPSELKALGNIRGAEYAYPERTQQVKAITHVMYNTAESWGYSQIEGPTLQPVEFYKLKSSDELLDDGYYVNTPGHTYMLRPEMTPTIAYMLADAEKSLTYPVRWYSDPQVYRNERPQSGRRRQFGQFNLDRFDLAPLTTDARAFADAEVISEAIDNLSRYGLTSEDVIVRINSRSLLERAFDVISIDSPATRKALLSVIDAKEKLPEDVFLSKAIDTGINDQQSAELIQWLSLPTLNDVATNEKFNSLVTTDEYKELQLVLELLGRQGYGDFVQYDPIIVRGLGYYTGTVFEAFDKKPDLSMRRSLLGGGRYDNFTQKFGGKLDVTGVGYGMGHIPLETVLESRGLFTKEKVTGPDYYLTIEDDENEDSKSLEIVLTLARAIRSAGKSAVIDSSINTSGEAKLKKQLNAANKITAVAAIIVQNRTEALTIKDLVTGEQVAMSLEEFLLSIDTQAA